MIWQNLLKLSLTDEAAEEAAEELKLKELVLELGSTSDAAVSEVILAGAESNADQAN